MKTATIELSPDEITKAIAEYVERDGWKVAGKVVLDISPGYSGADQRDYCAPSVKARVQVSR